MSPAQSGTAVNFITAGVAALGKSAVELVASYSAAKGWETSVVEAVNLWFQASSSSVYLTVPGVTKL
jgi:hypothetical protein